MLHYYTILHCTRLGYTILDHAIPYYTIQESTLTLKRNKKVAIETRIWISGTNERDIFNKSKKIQSLGALIERE